MADEWSQNSVANGQLAIGITVPAAPTSVTSGAANTFGSWVEISSGVGADTLILGLVVMPPSTSGQTYCNYQVALGGGGSEVVYGFVGAPYPSTFVTYPLWLPFRYPIPVANGTRVAVRSASNEASGAHKVYVIGHRQGDVYDDGLGINVVKWKGGTIPAVNVTGEPLVDINHVFGQSSPIDSGTAQSATATNLRLRSGAPGADVISNRYILIESATTGAGQFARCTAYDTTTKDATINGWSQGVTPTGTIKYSVIGF